MTGAVACVENNAEDHCFVTTCVSKDLRNSVASLCLYRITCELTQVYSWMRKRKNFEDIRNSSTAKWSFNLIVIVKLNAEEMISCLRMICLHSCDILPQLRAGVMRRLCHLCTMRPMHTCKNNNLWHNFQSPINSKRHSTTIESSSNATSLSFVLYRAPCVPSQ